MTYEEKSLEILRVMAQMAADGKRLTIAEDWGFGSATVIDQDGAHTHIGRDWYTDKQTCFESFVNGMYELLVHQRGLMWVRPSNVELTGQTTAQPLAGQR